MNAQTREPQYQFLIERQRREGLPVFGPMSGQVWQDDPRRVGFILSRYKFVAKMLSGRAKVLEVGCADAFGSRVVLQEVGSVTATDFDPVFIEAAKRCADPRWPIQLEVHDMLQGPTPEKYEAAYAVDVIEHIPKEVEERFVANIASSLVPAGVLILGSPSIHSQTYASPASKEGHVNCKDAAGLRGLLGRFFDNVFIFSMNDEVVHTGFYPLAHYLFAMGVGCRVPA